MVPQLSCKAKSLVIHTLAEELNNSLFASIDMVSSTKGPLVLGEQPVQKLTLLLQDPAICLGLFLTLWLKDSRLLI